MSKEFTFNQHNVCLNPELYKQWGEGIDSWCFTLCRSEKGWHYGYRISGGRAMGSSSPCSKSGDPLTREEAIEQATEILRKNANLTLRKPTEINNSVEHKRFAKLFLEWYNSTILQPTLF